LAEFNFKIILEVRARITHACTLRFSAFVFTCRMITNTIAHFLLFLVVSCPSPGTGVTIVPPDKTKNESRSCRLELESLRPSIVPVDLKATSWEELATRHLIEWLPEQKTTTTRSGFTFTGAHMCTPIKFGTERQPVKSRLLWVREESTLRRFVSVVISSSLSLTLY